jgi:hypothetical protein
MRPSAFSAFLLLAIGFVSTLQAQASDRSGAPADEFSLAVKMDQNDQGGSASATIRIHATREVLWRILTSCGEALQIVPGLKVCTVEETGPNLSWQRIHQVMDYSWYVPRVSYEVKANYVKPERIAFEKVAGDSMRLRGSWKVESDGEYSVAHYDVEFAPGFWVPHWYVRFALQRDLPKMLRSLRGHAEAAQSSWAG